MFESFGVDLGSLLAGFFGGRARDDWERAKDAYERTLQSCHQADAGSEDVLRGHLQENSVSGAYTEQTGSLSALALSSWREGADLREFTRRVDAYRRDVLRQGRR
jgi:hypothetical protein